MPKMLSVILPTYNEKENIALLIPKIQETFSKNRINGEVVVVDDSSPDGTASFARELAKKLGNIRVIERPKKEGLGAALRQAYDSCESELILSMDSDMSLDPNDIPRFIEKINEGYDLVVGSRRGAKASYEVGSVKTLVKKIISTVGNRMIRLLLDLPVNDFSLNFRVIRRDAWRALKTKEKLYVFLLEMIMQAHAKGYKISSIQVVFKDRMYGRTKTKLLQQCMAFLKNLLIFTWKYRIRRSSD